jgi:AcrR family transcriptional regulator
MRWRPEEVSSVNTPIEADKPRPGLRERKKERTRQAIQDVALRLFREQGYDQTTVEQIADAAEVSQSTFFRYFGSKEDVAMYDALDPVFIEALKAQPPHLTAYEAIRAAMHDVFGDPATIMSSQQERAALVFAVPELRERMIGEFVRTIDMFAGALAERLDRPADDFELRMFVGAVVGMGIALWLDSDGQVGPDFLMHYERAFSLLEDGLKL